MGKHLVLAGGGHAHMVTLANLQKFASRGHQVTVIGPSDHHYYSGMGPGMLGFHYAPDEIRFATRHVVEKKGGVFINAQVEHVDPDKRAIYCNDGGVLSYDVLSFNVGSFVPNAIVDQDSDRIYSVKPIERLLEARQRLVHLSREKKVTVWIVGGGAAAVEVAGNVWRLLTRFSRHGFEVGLYTHGRLLSRFPDKVQAAGRTSLLRRKIAVHEHTPVERICGNRIELRTGRQLRADIIFLATGVKPSPVISASGLPTGPDGGLLVNRYLQSIGHSTIFGGGDCIYFHDKPLDKVGVYAVRQNTVLYQNLMAALESRRLTAFDPGGAYLLIFNMGDRRGIFYKDGLLLGGRLAFKIKDYIDKRFMRRFQALE